MIRTVLVRRCCCCCLKGFVEQTWLMVAALYLIENSTVRDATATARLHQQQIPLEQHDDVHMKYSSAFFHRRSLYYWMLSGCFMEWNKRRTKKGARHLFSTMCNRAECSEWVVRASRPISKYTTGMEWNGMERGSDCCCCCCCWKLSVTVARTYLIICFRLAGCNKMHDSSSVSWLYTFFSSVEIWFVASFL